MSRRVVSLAVALSLFSAVPALAQLPGIEVSPYVGAFVPLTDLVDESDLDLTAGHKEGFGFGGRLGVMLPGPLGVEGSILYVLSDIESNDRGEVVSTDAHVWAASGKLIYSFGLPAAPVSINASGGIALIGRGGDDIDGTTDVGGVIGLGLRIDPPGIVALRADIESYLSSFQAEGEDAAGIGSQFQSDLFISAGLVFALGR